MDFDDDYVCLDTETTGLSPYTNAIIEICIVKMSSGKIVDMFSTLIDPEREISRGITRLTGITNDMVRGMPKRDEVLLEAVSFIGGLPILGHNISFDMRFIDANLCEMGFEPLRNRTIDTMQMSRRMFPTLENHKLSTVSCFLGAGEPTHRAFNDVYATYGCYEIMKCMERKGDVEELRKNLRDGRSKWSCIA